MIRVSRFLVSVLALAAPLVCAADPITLDDIRSGAKKHSEALVQQGFNWTLGIALKGKVDGGKPTRLNLVFPPAEEETRLNLWLQALGGEAVVRLFGADGTALFTWAAQQGEFSVAQRMAPGKYVLELDASATQGGRALWGVKGPMILVPTLDIARYQDYPANPQAGFFWPYTLRMPTELKCKHLLVAPNNTGFVTTDPELIKAAAAGELERHTALAERLGCVLLMPMFPRPPSGNGNLYLHALTRESMQIRQPPAWQRVDLQLGAMMRDAHKQLQTQGFAPLDPRALLWGFSASGSFVNRFALLHPQQVLAVASGSPGGWPIAPIERHDGATLHYPVGIADVQALTGKRVSIQAAKSVAWYFYMGDQDANDAVVFRDSFSKADEKLIFEHFGTTPLARWDGIKQIYVDQGLRAQFLLYPNVAHAVTPEIHAGIATFFETQLKQAAATPP